MAIEDDLIKIKNEQEKFKNDYGAYFEMDYKEHNIPIPKSGDVLSLKKIKRFVPPSGDDRVFPVKNISEVAFVPTAKDYKFIIGRGIKRDKNTGGLVADCWYVQAIRELENGILDIRVLKGGNPELLKADGMYE